MRYLIYTQVYTEALNGRKACGEPVDALSKLASYASLTAANVNTVQLDHWCNYLPDCQLCFMFRAVTLVKTETMCLN